MTDRDDVRVLVPTYNEAETIGSVVESFREEGFEKVLVVDGGSTDGTRDIAEGAGATVVEQSEGGEGSGKGNAVIEGIRITDEPILLMLDGDSTYRAADADAMLEPIFSGRADHVIGDRFADMESGAMSRLNRVGNRIINTAFQAIHGRDFRDILSGYRAFRRDALERIALSESGFGIETEMAVECVKHNVPTEVVPITYLARPDESDTNLHPFRDGATIILTLYRMAKTNNPIFYFGSVGLVSTVVGVILGLYVAIEWITVPKTSHEVIAVLGAFAILFGVQMLMFGVLSDMIVTVNREQTRRLEALTERLSGQRGRPPAGERFAVGERPEDATGDAASAADGATAGTSAEADPPDQG